jgi:hypothetical protein
LEAWKQMKEEDEEASFHVVVVDSGPLLEGTFRAFAKDFPNDIR